VLSDEQRTGTTSPVWNDVITPQTGDKWLNATLEVVDDAGATTTTQINRYLADNPPNVQILEPENKTYFKYEKPVEVKVTDSDSNPGETYTCDTVLDGQPVSFTVQENNTYNSSTRTDLGSDSLTVSCSNGQGGNSSNVHYFTEEFQQDSVSGSTQTFETENESFSANWQAGDMANTVETRLYYNQRFRDTETSTVNGYTSASTFLNHVIGLVQNNQTMHDWKIVQNVNYTKFNGDTTVTQFNSTTKTQEVLHAYEFGNHALENGFTQLEGSTLNYTASVNKIYGSAKGQFTAETTYNQTNTDKTLTQNQLNFSETFNTDLINSSTSKYGFNTNISLIFNGDTRYITSQKNLDLDNLVISKNTGDKTLELNLKDEVNNSLQKGEIQLGLKTWNPDQPGKTQFFGFELTGQNSYDLFIQPSYAEVKMKSFTDNSLEYLNTDTNYPKRRYYYLDETLNNQTFDTSLYMLKENEGTQVQFELLDEDLNPLPRHLIRVERVFPSQENTKTVAKIKTGGQGKGQTFLDTDERYVFTVFNEEGELVEQIGAQTITSNPTVLEIEPDVQPSFANLVNDVNFNDVTKTNDTLTVSYVSETERLNSIELKVYKETLFGNTLIAEDNSTDLQSVLQVSGFNASEDRLFYEVNAEFAGDKINLDTGSFGDLSSDYGLGGIFVSLMMFLTLTFAGLNRPSTSIALGMVAILATAWTGLMPITQSALISVLSLGAVMIWRMSSQS